MAKAILMCSMIFALSVPGHAGNAVPIESMKTPIDTSTASFLMRLRLVPDAHLVIGDDHIALRDIRAFVAQKRRQKIIWTLYLPDRLPIDTAILLFEQFAAARSKNVAVYAEKPDTVDPDAVKREIRLELWPNDPVGIVTRTRDSYPPLLEKYRVYLPDKELFYAKCGISGIQEILPLLLETTSDKHVRLQECGEFRKGLAADRYVETLKALKGSGVLYLSVSGVFLE